jgi:hypothetical protein
MKEAYLLTGELEPTNDAYAIAKIAGIKMCQSYNQQYGTNFISVMPTNLYGPHDNFDLKNSHVLPAMLRKFHCPKVRRAYPRRTLGQWNTEAGICLFRGYGRCVSSCHEKDQRGRCARRSVQYWFWLRSDDQRTRPENSSNGRTSRRYSLGRVSTGRHLQKTARYLAPLKAGLERKNRFE